MKASSVAVSVVCVHTVALRRHAALVAATRPQSSIASTTTLLGGRWQSGGFPSWSLSRGMARAARTLIANWLYQLKCHVMLKACPSLCCCRINLNQWRKKALFGFLSLFPHLSPHCPSSRTVHKAFIHVLLLPRLCTKKNSSVPSISLRSVWKRDSRFGETAATYQTGKPHAHMCSRRYR